MNRHKIITLVLRCSQFIVAGILTVMMIKAMKMLYLFMYGDLAH